MNRIGRTLATLLVLLLAAAVSPAAALPLPLPKTGVFYVVVPHPDDEFNIWSMIQAHSATDYIVWISLTQGEGTVSCLDEHSSKNEEPPYEPGAATWLAEGLDYTAYKTGPYRYQGPNSPVGQPNLGERHPYGDPWQGLHTQACKDARIASWHWFLDDTEHLGSGASLGIGDDPWQDDDYQGRRCPPGAGGSGPGRPISKRIGCADVWSDTNVARVSFDLGNLAFGAEEGNLLTHEEVVAAVETVRDDRAAWGIPLLPERGMVSAGVYFAGNPGDPTCLDQDDHRDHRVVQEVLSQHDFGAGPQYGPSSCPSDPNLKGAGAVFLPADPATLVAVQYVDPHTRERIGPGPVNYGWVFSTYGFNKSKDLYFKRFGP